MRRFTLHGWLGLGVLISLTGSLGYISYHQMYQRGLQAEARLMLSYMQTLQSVYRTEHGQFASFDQFYGAPIAGHDHCEQPLGAAHLGFLVHGCHDPKAPAPRYAYRSVERGGSTAAYQLEAVSGSDGEGRSFVCFFPDAKESWFGTQNQELSLTESCW